MEELVLALKQARQVVIFSGAGVSTSAGIPDYRSRETGLLVRGQTWRDINPEKARPTPAHHFAALLHSMGILRRIFTQNIDGLYQRAGLPESMVVEWHGSLAGFNVIDFGGNFEDDIVQQAARDLNEEVDVAIVMGTSLQVYPFAALPNMVSKKCRRFYLNREFSPECLVQNRPTEGLYSSPYSHSAPIRIGARKKVKTGATWYDSRYERAGKYRGKWRQYMIEGECDALCHQVIQEWDAHLVTAQWRRLVVTPPRELSSSCALPISMTTTVQ